MTIEQKMLDERRRGFKEGRMDAINEAIAALKGILEPATIAEKFKVPLEQVLEIREQKKKPYSGRQSVADCLSL